MDYPYAVPENWKWTYLKDITECKDNLRQPVNATERAERLGTIPYYGATGQAGWINGFLTDEELVLLGEDGAPFLDKLKDKAYLICGKAWVNNHAHILKSYFGHCGNLYILHYLNNFNFDGYVNGTTRLKLTQSSMNSIPVPLPPLPEQHRIVARIESLFSKLDEAKEKTQSVLEGFENRRAAILHKAFTGELTKNWRDERGIGSDSWKLTPFENTISIMQNGLSKRKGICGKAYVVLRLANLSEDDFIEEDLREVLLNDKEIETHKLSINDVIMIRVNGSKDNVGKQFLMNAHKQWAFCDHLIRIRYEKNVLPKYMIHFSKTDWYSLYIKENMVSSAGQNTISRKGLIGLKIPVPSIDEQREIVRILDSLLTKEQETKQAAEAVIKQIDMIKKSILARAFRGELGTNDPNDEPAQKSL